MKSAPAVLLKAVSQDGPHTRWCARGQCIPIRIDTHDPADEVGDGLACERLAAGEHFIEDTAKRPDIRSLVGSLATHLFRRHVRSRTDQDAGPALAGCEDRWGVREAHIAA